jgi:hypothetical protein
MLAAPPIGCRSPTRESPPNRQGGGPWGTTADWGVFLGDVPAATAILDRFLAHAIIVQVTGKSYRLRQRASTTDDEETVDRAAAVEAKNAPLCLNRVYRELRFGNERHAVESCNSY